MAENSKIEWTDHTFNPWEGCQKVGPGCDHCYAETRNARFGGGQAVNWGPGAPRRRTSASNWAKPLKWNAEAERSSKRVRVFCASLADVFDNAVDKQWRVDLFNLILSTPHLHWLLLTKRIGNAAHMIAEVLPESLKSLPADHALAWPWPHVWIGATITSQAEADRDIPKLLTVPAAKRFLSMEPLLGPVDLRLPIRTWANSRGDLACDHCCNGDRCDDPAHFARGHPDWAPHCRCPYCRGTGKGKPIDWVIVGGESGPGARPMSPDWARSLRDQCEEAGVPYLFKQWGEWLPVLGQRAGVPIRETTSTRDGWVMGWVGKKAAGRLLDGRTWDGVPAYVAVKD